MARGKKRNREEEIDSVNDLELTDTSEVIQDEEVNESVPNNKVTEDNPLTKKVKELYVEASHPNMKVSEDSETASIQFIL